MKKTIISIIASLVASVAVAQTNQYPNTSGTITKSGYTYKYDSPYHNGIGYFSYLIQLHNASVLYLNVDYANRDGSPLTEKEILEGPLAPLFSGQSMTDDQVRTMINGKFTATQKATFAGNGRTLVTEVRVDSSTGKVVDVYFRFLRNGPATNIPVETYRSIELALKQTFSITVTAEGQKKNYIPFSWMLEFWPN